MASLCEQQVSVDEQDKHPAYSMEYDTPPHPDSTRRSTEGSRAKTENETGNYTRKPDIASAASSNTPNKENSEKRPTVNPETTEWTTVNRKNNNQRKRVVRKLRQALRLEDIFKPESEHFEKYYLIRFPRMNINSEVDIIKTDEDLRAQVGKLQKVTKAGRETLLIESGSPGQSEKIKELKKLAGVVVVVEPHSRYNTVKGVVRSKAFGQSTETSLRDHLAEQGVSDVKRVKLRRNGELQETDTYILTFNRTTAPRAVHLSEWHHELVEEYKYRPQQCYNCQKLGHVAKYCRQTEATCARCGEQGHEKTVSTGSAVYKL